MIVNADRIPPAAVRGVARAPLVAFAQSLGFVAAYLALDWVSYIHPMQRYNITPWNPEPALAIALLSVRGWRWAPVVLVAVIAAEWFVRGAPAGMAGTFVTALLLTGGYGAIASVLRGRAGVSFRLVSHRDIARLVIVIALGALAMAAAYVGVLVLSGREVLMPSEAILRFWVGDTAGILVTLPLVLMMTVRERRVELLRLLARRETFAHALAIALTLALVVASPPEQQTKIFYVLFLPLIAVAARYGLGGAMLTTLVIQAVIIASDELSGYQVLTLFELEALLIALAITALFLGATVDELRRTEGDLRRSLRMAAAGEMASALAHELNQPLAALSSYARAGQILAQAPRENAMLLDETLAKLVGEAGRAADVVRRLRDFFREGILRLEVVDLQATLASVVAAEEERAAPRGITVAWQVAEDFRVRADQRQLEVVLRNLLSNAVEAASAQRPGRVDVEAKAQREFVRVSVRDSGPGVAAEDVARIFEPFETTRASGMGMGLAISRAIVEAHGGELWVEPGRRCGLFCFTLPRVPRHG
ncbi:MAG TPA: ATP-binding protein [Usitatibacter sp.]|jgi:signal transduction histidine kinase|nr:ATP-binding protein [Usitatibacter sp.]